MSTLVSHSKGFVFIHLAKCAGTSVTTIFEPYGWPWLLSSKLVRNGVHILGQYTGLDLTKYTGKYVLPLHADADLLVTRFPETDFNTYFRFTVVRSPWALMVSQYEFSRRPRLKYSNPKKYYQQQKTSFSDFVRSICIDRSPRNKVDRLFRTSSGSLDMDYVAKVETLGRDMDIICKAIGISSPCIPHRNKSSHARYTDYYTQETLALVKEAYGRDIDAFCYRYGD